MVETQSQRNGVNTTRRYSYLKDKLQNGLTLFIKHESFGGVLLAVCVLFAMLIANSSYKEVYFWLQKFELGIALGNFEPKIELVHFVNDVLMSFFFLLVGLEMKREVLYGELAGFKKVSFSVLAAIGGIIAPIVLYLQFTSGTPFEKGFGIAMSTDTAFALGVILMLGERVPKIVKIFLVTLAVADDLGAISVIAIFYSQHIDMFWIYLALIVVGLLGYCNYRDTKYISIYFLLGIVLWVCILFSGIHVTIAAVILAFAIPGRTRVNRKYFANMLGEFERIKRVTNDGADITNIQEREKIGFWKSTWLNIKSFMTSSPSARNVNMAKASELVYMLDSIGTYSRYAQNPLLRIEHALQPICAYFIVPIFAFMNAGVSIDSHIELTLDGVMLGTIFGLVIGKPIGIFLFAFLGEKLKLSVRPDGLSNFHIIAVGAISGVGFTMSIFVANLAYTDDMSAIDMSKISILIASSIAVILGIVLMAIATRNDKPEQKDQESPAQPSLF